MSQQLNQKELEELEELGNQLQPKYNTMYGWNDPRNRPVIKKARNLYLQNYPFERIFLETGILYAVYIKRERTWRRIKERIDQQLIAKMRDKAVVKTAEEFVEKGLHIGLKFLDNVIKRNIELDVKDFKFIMDSVMAIHRVKQLEAGAATDITVYQNMSPKELKVYLEQTFIQVKSKHADIIEYLPEDEA